MGWRGAGSFCRLLMANFGNDGWCVKNVGKLTKSGVDMFGDEGEPSPLEVMLLCPALMWATKELVICEAAAN